MSRSSCVINISCLLVLKKCAHQEPNRRTFLGLCIFFLVLSFFCYILSLFSRNIHEFFGLDFSRPLMVVVNGQNSQSQALAMKRVYHWFERVNGFVGFMVQNDRVF